MALVIRTLIALMVIIKEKRVHLESACGTLTGGYSLSMDASWQQTRKTSKILNLLGSKGKTNKIAR